MGASYSSPGPLSSEASSRSICALPPRSRVGLLPLSADGNYCVLSWPTREGGTLPCTGPRRQKKPRPGWQRRSPEPATLPASQAPSHRRAGRREPVHTAPGQRRASAQPHSSTRPGPRPRPPALARPTAWRTGPGAWEMAEPLAAGSSWETQRLGLAAPLPRPACCHCASGAGGCGPVGLWPTYPQSGVALPRPSGGCAGKAAGGVRAAAGKSTRCLGGRDARAPPPPRGQIGCELLWGVRDGSRDL